MKHIVVVGGGLAALRVTESLYGLGFEGDVTVIGDEETIPYNRPPLSKAVLAKADVSGLPLPRVHADRANWRLGIPAAGLADDLLGVRLANGDQVTGDALVLATGVRARRVLKASHTSVTHVIRTQTDAHRLREKLRPGARVLILGAGFLGCEVATSAAARGCSVHVVEPLAYPLAVLGSLVGQRAATRLRAFGVRLTTGGSVASVRAADNTLKVTMQDGTSDQVDVIVEAVGAVPNTEAFAGQGLDLSNGVLTDQRLRVLRDGSPLQNVVAAGDVARFPLPGFDITPRRIEHWNLAFDTAKLAAHTVLSGLGMAPEATAPGQPLPSFWCEFAGGRLDALGIPALGLADVRVIDGDPSDHDAPLSLGYHDQSGRLVGAVFCDTRKGMPQLRRSMSADLCPTL